MTHGRTPLLFVYGCGRSGTTLLGVMLDGHPRLAMTFDSKFVVEALQCGAAASFDGAGPGEALLGAEDFARWGLDPNRVRRAWAEARPAGVPDALRVLFRTCARERGADRYGDKTNRISHHVPAFAEAFPEARFIHLIRDGRNVALSYMDMYWGPTDWDSAARKWMSRVKDGRKHRASLGEGRYQEARYEDLIERPEAVLRAACEFADLDYDPATLDYTTRVGPLLEGPLAGPAPIHDNLRRPPTPGLRDWRTQMAEADRAAFEARAGGLLRELGYSLADEL